ncbi:hypothetical protein U1Q18_024319 [Sarracenia purpurea var. burkii]
MRSGMTMAGRGGRDRFRRDHPPRSEEKSHHGRSNARPSRHLWVGNLSHDMDEHTLADHFLQFGDLESVSFQSGRSYAFINFKNEEDAFAAVRALQGFVVAGSALRIEFAKADKSSTSSHDEDYLQRRDEQRSSVRGSPFSLRDSRSYRSSPDPYPNNFKSSDKNAEPPSEVLWIGFPALLKVDEGILRKAFSPFGEIEKITAFSGRSYAFVRFKNVMAASRAKETLQGKLFGNPRVHICFAKSESGSSNSGRNSMNSPPSPRFKSYGRAGSSANFRQDRNFNNLVEDPTLRSPRYTSNLESGDPDITSFGRKGNSWTGGFEQRRFQEPRPELGLRENMYERHVSPPPRERGARFRDFSPQKFPQKGSFYDDDSWDLPEDTVVFHGAKKLKTESFNLENELPEYPFSGADQAKHVFPRLLPDFPQRESLDKNFEPGPFGYKQVTDRGVNLTQPYGERSDHWNASYDGFQAGSGSLPPNPVELKRLTPELHPPALTKEWKWEGTIAKGGTPVCRARCFPVGKVLDMTLPEFLDCTARTGLDMLAKHYYQAANAWVVFFVPECDADIGFYNEFMHYLEEKQRAAVAKLDESTTLFLVPPSEFSEKVLKVPGKLSISGVILRLEHPGPSDSGPSLHHPPPDKKDTPSFMSYHPKSPSPSRPFPSLSSFQNMGSSGAGKLSFPANSSTAASPASFYGSAHGVGSLSDATTEHRNEMLHQRNSTFGPNWSPHHPQNLSSGARNLAPSQVSNTAIDLAAHGYNASVPRTTTHETSSASYTTEQLAQLASSLFGQARQSGTSGPSLSKGEDFRQSSTVNPENPYRTPQKYPLQNHPVNSELSSSQFAQGNQQCGGTQEEDADPQKRLQATLQLAAALLQQIQQGKGT